MKTTKETFIIIATARTGSKMLIEFLKNQKDVYAVGELLHNNPKILIRKINANKNNPQQEIIRLIGNDSSRIIRNRDLNFDKYLNLFLSVKESLIQGFKVFYYTHIIKGNIENEFLKYVKENNVKVIHLTRENTILQFFSLKLVKIGITNFLDTDIKFDIDENRKTDIEYSEYVKYRNNLITEKKQVRELCKLHNIPIHEVTYEELCSDDYKEHYSNIMKYLNLDANEMNDIVDSGQQKQKKNQTYSLSEIFNNTNEFIDDSNKDNIITELEIKTLNKIK